MVDQAREDATEIRPLDYLNEESIRYLYQVSRSSHTFLIGVREYQDDDYSSLELVEKMNGKGKVMFGDVYHHMKLQGVTRSNASDLAHYLFNKPADSMPKNDEIILASIQTNSSTREAENYVEKYWLPFRRPAGDASISFLLKALAILAIGFALNLGLTALLLVGAMAFLRWRGRRKKPRASSD